LQREREQRFKPRRRAGEILQEQQNDMSSILRAAGAVFALAMALGGAGCVSQPVNTGSTTNSTNANTTTAAANTAPETARTAPNGADELALTLPLLDAFFHEETFASTLKAKLQLTDEQVEKLRSVARSETGKLRETETGDYSGTTSAARARAEEQIRAVIGEEKTRQLSAFLNERWSGANDDDGGAASASTNQGTGASNQSAAHASKNQPNAIPTDTRIVVNAPAYRMDVFEGGRLVKSYKIGIGYPEFPLPTGQRKAASIIFNPTWTPPDEPWVEASNKVKPGQKIEAGSKLNPLGPIKIPIGLPSLIHGGKSPAKLGGFASHGCVGLTTPQVQEFARTLAELSGTQLSDEQITAYARTPRETKEVKLARAVPVELRYETIVVEDGRLHIYRDVYDRDTNTEENLRAVLAAQGVSLEQLSEKERADALNALKEMSRDASGKLDASQPAPADDSKNSNASRRADASGNRKASQANRSDASGKQVTQTVKGRKEIVVEIAALKGKGYPAPVDLSTGGAAKKQAAATTTTKALPPSGKRR
jgi:hypothetical protein